MRGTSCSMFLLLIAIVPSSGCMSFSQLIGKKRSDTLDTSYLKQAGYSIPPGGLPTPVALDPSKGPAIVMEVRGDSNHLESIPLPRDKAVFIEDLVRQANLHERLGALSISIMRPNGSGLPPVRLDVQTNSQGKAKNPGQNYAVLPGDHIIVGHDQRTHLERFIENALPKSR